MKHSRRLPYFSELPVTTSPYYLNTIQNVLFTEQLRGPLQILCICTAVQVNDWAFTLAENSLKFLFKCSSLTHNPVCTAKFLKLLRGDLSPIGQMQQHNPVFSEFSLQSKNEKR